MSEAKFTKGEWRVHDAHGYVGVSFLDGGSVILGRSNSENKANSDLIAAAPNHDAVLVMVSEKLPVTPNVFGGDYMITLTQEEVNQIRKSLAKVRGEL